MEKDWKRKSHQLEADMKSLRSEKNALSMVKNKIFKHYRCVKSVHSIFSIRKIFVFDINT